MSERQAIQLTLSVREFVAMALQQGDLVSMVRQRISGLEGSRAHSKVQKARPDGYHAEVSIKHTFAFEDTAIRIQGRIDGIYENEESGLPILEELKSTRVPLDRLEPRPAHWAQLRVYAHIIALQRQLERVPLRLTYLELPDLAERAFDETPSAAELAAEFERLLQQLLPVLRRQLDWRSQRAASDFPFDRFRAGQLEMIRQVYQYPRLLVEAPTGIGKTMSALYPALKMRQRGLVEQIFFLTARNAGKAAAELAMDALLRAGFRSKSITLTAKDHMCCIDGVRCDPAVCENAIGYYERLDGGIAEMFLHDRWTPERILEIARRHRLCPFQFSIDLCLWADVIICDYNYVFDPGVWLRPLFDDKTQRKIFLIDEAHNLVDRGRSMFSSELRGGQFMGIYRAVKADEPALARSMNAVNRRIRALKDTDTVSFELPDRLVNSVKAFVRAGETWLDASAARLDGGGGGEPLLSWREDFMDLFFEAMNFVQAAERFDRDYRFIQEGVGQRDRRVRIFCVDPGASLAGGMKRAARVVSFSATLVPMDYYLEMTGMAGAAVLRLPSPFPVDNLAVFVAESVPTVYRRRSESYQPIADLVQRFRAFREGNLLVYFPSYKYLEAVSERLNLPHLAQIPRMDAAARADFLDRFQAGGRELGLAVMGGQFGEAIDLVGDRLSGAIIVGVGLPPVGPERDVIRKHFAARGRDGFHYAYTFPGWARVLQAIGRVIRRESDTGAVLLIDERYASPTYRQLFPEHWPEVRWSGKRP